MCNANVITSRKIQYHTEKNNFFFQIQWSILANAKKLTLILCDKNTFYDTMKITSRYKKKLPSDNSFCSENNKRYQQSLPTNSKLHYAKIMFIIGF